MSSVLKSILTCNCGACLPSGFCCTPSCGRRKAKSQYRVVYPNHLLESTGAEAQAAVQQSTYANNRITTTKYTILTFLPKNLFEQFHRFANLYFIFIVLLNWVPQIEAFGKEVSMIPILFVLGVTAVKDAYEDYRRYRSDKKVNHAEVRIWSTADNRYVKSEWRHVMVGDIVHLSVNEIVCADILLLRAQASSEGALGTCFLETSNLDGESNLKQRQVVGSLRQQHEQFRPPDFRSSLECELPNNHIYKFNGFLLHPDGSREPVSKDNLLLRGCEIRNTDFVEGLVVYAGRETKAMLNNSGPRYKRSRLERLMNWDIMWCVLMLLLMCFVGAVGSGIWLGLFDEPSSVPFLAFMTVESDSVKYGPELEAFIVFWTYVIVLQIMIPISLYVTIELVKLGQVYFISQDVQLYDPASDRRVLCRALNIPEELGQIQYVMSDKTGTLTENRMIFRRCMIGTTDYGPAGVNAAAEPGDTSAANLVSRPVSARNEEDVTVNPQLVGQLHEMGSEVGTSAKRKTMYHFFINMAVCNTVVVSPHPHVDKLNGTTTLLKESSEMNASGMYLVANGRLTAHEHLDEAGVEPRSSTPNGTPLDPTPSTTGSTHPLFFVDSPANDITSADNTPNALGNEDERRTSLPPVPVPLIQEEPPSSEPRIISPIPEQPDDPDTLNRPASLDVVNASNGSSDRRRFLGLPPISSVVNQVNLSQMVSTMHPRNIMQPALNRIRSTLSRSASPASTPGVDGMRQPCYEAESPDELALVKAAAAHGMKLVRRRVTDVTVELPDGVYRKFDVLHVLPFDSVRKRMSVIVRDPVSQHLVLYTKGADIAILEQLSAKFQAKRRGQEYVYRSQEYINLYASYGLRTLCLAKRVLDPAVYEEWLKLHQEAECSIEDREELLFQSACEIETDLELLGVTGIEDRLQDGVPECIAALREAGMKVWVLTGDKIETAVNIAYACRLFVYGMDLIQLSARNEDDTATVLDHHIDSIRAREHGSGSEAPLLSDNGGQGIAGRGLVVDGRTLAYCLHPRLENKFLQLLQRCTAVLCCRATPLQKASVVRLMKEKLSALTLAIGDGANDVGMIQAADVGVGISGQEGMQAVMSSDYAIARFRHLRRLLLVHGHWCYQRLALMVLYFFYKNAVFVFCCFWYQLFNGWSAQVNIDQLYLMLYNLIFTSVPPVVFAVLDCDASDHMLLTTPHLYEEGRENRLYRTYSFWLHMGDALWQSLVIYFVPHFAYWGEGITQWAFGTVQVTMLMLCNQYSLLLEVHTWNWLLVGSVVISVLAFFFFALAYNALAVACCSPDPPFWIAQEMMSNGRYWLVVLLVSVLSMLPSVTFRAIKQTMFPQSTLAARLAQREKSKRLQPSRSWLSWLPRSKTKVAIVNDHRSSNSQILNGGAEAESRC